MTSFSAQVSSWTKQTRERTNAVYRTAIEETVNDMKRTNRDGGNLPIDTGNLRRSFLLSTTGLPNLSDGPFGSEQDVGLVLAGVNYGDTVYGGWQARYARRQNYGGGGITGNYFQDLALAKWTQNVKTAELKLRTT